MATDDSADTYEVRELGAAGLLPVCIFLGVVFGLLATGSEGRKIWQLAPPVAAILGVIAGVLAISRKTMRVVIDQSRGTIRVGPEGRSRVIPMRDISHVELSAIRLAPPKLTGQKFERYRLELVLKTKEKVPTIRGHGQFSESECHALMDAITEALKAQAVPPR